MKKVLAFLMAVAIMLSICACKKTETGDKTSTTEKTTSVEEGKYVLKSDEKQKVYKNQNNYMIFYFEGEKAHGIGSPHTPENYVWHIALAMQGLTSTDPAEKKMLLDMLMTTHADCWFMHESFSVDDPAEFTREWFAWANTICSEFFIDCINNGII